MWVFELPIRKKYILLLYILAVLESSADEAMKTSLHQLDRSDITLQTLPGILEEKGFRPSEFAITENTITSENLELIKFVNKLKAFKDRSKSIPYFLILVKLENGNIMPCITTEPRKIKKDISWKDNVIELSSKDRDLIRECEVLDTNSEYCKLDRKQIWEKYFLSNGGLNKSKYPHLVENKNFIYCLIQKGYYAHINDEAGYLFIE